MKEETVSKAEIIKRPAERFAWTVKKNAWTAVIGSLIILLFGIFLVVWPDVTIVVVANILGVILIANGIYQIINYFVVKGQDDFLNNNLLTGVLSLIVGIATIVFAKDIAGILRIIIGIWMIYEAFVRMNTAIKLHSAGIKVWAYILIVAIAMLLLGVFVTFNAGAVVQLIGWMMIISGAIGIVSDIMYIQQVNTVIDIFTKDR